MYRIIGADGKEYGPINADQLRQWMAEGRANAQTKVLLEGTTEWKTLGELPEFFPAPPAGAPAGMPPGAPPPGLLTSAPPSFPSAPAPLVGAADQINGPAIGLIITGALNIVFSIGRAILMMAGIGMNALQARGGATEAERMILAMSGTFSFVIGGLGLIGGIVILLGGIKMRKLQNYGFCLAASIIAMIPCVSACCIVGLPIGIWALVVLAKPEVKSAFH